DPVDDVVRRDGFLRQCVELARRRGEVIVAPIHEQGVFFLVNHRASVARVRQALSELASRASALARRLGFTLHVGISLGIEGAPLHTRYRSAFLAAEQALSRGLKLVEQESRPELGAERLRQLRRELGRTIDERPGLVSARFERYLQVALAHAGYRHDAVRAELDSGLERLAESLLASGFVDDKSFSKLRGAADPALENARTLKQVVDTYRRLVSELEEFVESPTLARQAQGTRQAVSFMREHLAEPLILRQVARIAGFAPEYFCRLFKQQEGTSFTAYLRGLRFERAKQLLKGTELSVDQVQKLAGFRSRTNFFHVFRLLSGTTPIEFRRTLQRPS
ncbi:MAG TPA: AraC family transcriptional regulator, partial [Polyangiaceae bacterium]|nr:AraC family transcriptional regulator [Polyangiaceae bacterium]